MQTVEQFDRSDRLIGHRSVDSGSACSPLDAAVLSASTPEALTALFGLN